MKNLFFAAIFVIGLSFVAFSQPRPADTGPGTAKPAPEIFDAKYEGGLFGYNKKISGSLKFDDANSRLIFRGKDQKEVFGIPYDALLVVYPNTKSVTSTTGNVISHVPLPGAGLAGLMKSKQRYLVVQFRDPDADVSGTVSFKVENKDLVESAVQTLGEKAKLTKRGDSYYRPRPKPAI